MVTLIERQRMEKAQGVPNVQSTHPICGCVYNQFQDKFYEVLECECGAMVRLHFIEKGMAFVSFMNNRAYQLLDQEHQDSYQIYGDPFKYETAGNERNSHLPFVDMGQ